LGKVQDLLFLGRQKICYNNLASYEIIANRFTMKAFASRFCPLAILCLILFVLAF